MVSYDILLEVWSNSVNSYGDSEVVNVYLSPFCGVVHLSLLCRCMVYRKVLPFI